MLRAFYAGARRSLPKDLPTSFIRRSWRDAVTPDGVIDGAAYELCCFAELRDRLRAGDIWVAGSRQYRAVEDQRPLSGRPWSRSLARGSTRR
jgi:hypothetical protein